MSKTVTPADTNSVNTTTEPNVADMAAQTKPGRNRAVDAYRAMAMILVAFGHWAAIDAYANTSGSLEAGNALEAAPSMSPVSWLFQVMPLFFVVGGYSSAASLGAHLRRNPERRQDWVSSRLVRMLAPTIVLAGFWLAVITVTAVTGTGLGLASVAAIGAAIPLWFLANYTIDTAVAPYLLPKFQARPVAVTAWLLGLFGTVEVVRMLGVPYIPMINWVVGWLLFQVAGFAWYAGLLPRGRGLAALSATLWVTAITAVRFGPWPMAMVHFPGLENSPTHPPTLALLLFGSAYASTAILAAPMVTDWLSHNAKAWTAVIVANTMSMSVYLWHMTAATAATGIFYALGWLPTAQVGTFTWWMQKLPLIACSLAVLATIIAIVGRFERNSLLNPAQVRKMTATQVSATAIAVSLSVEAWIHHSTAIAVVGMASILALYRLLTVPSPTSDAAYQSVE